MNIVWGDKDVYIHRAMAIEFALRTGAELTLLPGIRHFPHLQDPEQALKEVRASFR